jgi:8-oxo-dGTP diphosphatase
MTMLTVPHCFYRVSVKALILDATRTKFLIVQEHDGSWDFPGGGLEWGATPHDELIREIQEEMGITPSWIAPHPSYFFTGLARDGEAWMANVVYETSLPHLTFTPSNECVATRFVSADEMRDVTNAKSNLIKLAELFDPLLHTRG